jgi:radical SAM protein with 4Fe4S-binding SPASM domain
MSLSDFEQVLGECQKAGIMQIALGGGEPTLHPNFRLMLKKIHQANIVPNLTTNGYILKWQNIYAIARYAGAVALSLENTHNDFEKRRGFSFATFEKNIIKLKIAGIKLVFQITISQGNLNTVENTIKYLKKYKPYGFLFLAYKPQGRGLNFDKTLSNLEYEKVKEKISTLFIHADKDTKIGFDCCLTPALMSLNIKNKNSFQGCTASRTSIAIMPNLDIMPCSFLHRNKTLPNLKKQSLLDIWQGDYFNNFRNSIKQKTNNRICSNCPEKNICLGGCPEFDLTKCGNM